MPTFKLDGRDIPFEPGDTVIVAAHRAGVDIPHYCWHPGLSVAANCRMCLVEVGPPPGRPAMMLDVLNWDRDKRTYVKDKKPKLQPACQQMVGEGMEVKSQTSQHVARARAAVQELLLLHHPVDCPICDQAGECRLQDYWLEHQGTKKRMRDEPIHKPKGVVFGPTIVYDAERCIMCTRCIRVCEEVALDPVLSMRERGNLNEIVLSPGRELDHPYTLMTEYVCPVGALTAVDFRFKARVWFLRSVRSVCTGCATGCNSFTDFDPRYQKVYRYRPRENLAVNKHWMCDEGMLDYHRIHEGRVLQARVDGEVTTRVAAVDRAVELIKQYDPERVAVVVSPQHSNEDNFVLLTLAREHLGVQNVFMGGKAPGQGDKVLRHTDKNPNARGVTALSGDRPPKPAVLLLQGLSAQKFDLVLALGSLLPDAKAPEALKKAESVVAFATHEGPLVEAATVVVPVSSWAECDGVFVNARGLAQQSDQAIAPQGASRPAWKVLAELGRALGYPLKHKTLKDVRRAMAGEQLESTGERPQVEAGAAP